MKVKFMPLNVEHEIEFNETVLHLAQRHDIHIQSVCKGLPSCAECRVQIKEGEHHVLPPSSKELSLIGTAHYIDHSRLSCQLRCFGDVIVDVSEQIEKEGRAAKRPQGRASRADGEQSFAVKGNIIEEYKDDSFFGGGEAAATPAEEPQAPSEGPSQNEKRPQDSHRDRNRRHGQANQGKNDHRNSRPNHQGAKNSQNSRDLRGQGGQRPQNHKSHENKGNS